MNFQNTVVMYKSQISIHISMYASTDSWVHTQAVIILMTVVERIAKRSDQETCKNMNPWVIAMRYDIPSGELT